MHAALRIPTRTAVMRRFWQHKTNGMLGQGSSDMAGQNGFSDGGQVLRVIS
jgi:hypothetical protein